MTTLPQLLVDRARSTPHAVALREKHLGIWQEVSWARYLERVRLFALGLRALGVGRGDKVAIIGDNRPEWFIAELSAQSLGAASVGLFQDATAAEVQYMVEHCDARVVVVEDQEQVDKLLAISENLPKLEYIVYVDSRGLRNYDTVVDMADPRLVALRETPCSAQRSGLAAATSPAAGNFARLSKSKTPETPLIAFELVEAFGAQCEAREFDQLVADGKPDDLALLCYTSGTTGKPKGAMLSHRNLLAAVGNLQQIDPVQPGDNYLSFLPCGWIAEQAIGLTAALCSGQTLNFPEEPETVQADLREIGPRLMLAAPRIWENLASSVAVKAQDASWVKRHVYEWGMRVGYACVDQWRVPPITRIQHAVAEYLVFAPVRDQLGLRELRRAYTGGAALGPDTLRFFRALGINLKQVYGQTEIGGLSVVHRDGQVDGETVGSPVPNTQVRIADNGEILSRSDGLFLGYYKDPAATAATVQDGWLHSGDAGFLNARGELVVLDRLKDLMTLASGQTFAPQYVENKLKFSPYVKEAVAIGQGRPYVVVLVNIDMPNVGTWAEKHGIAYTTYADLAHKAEVSALIAEAVARVNTALQSATRIERFVLLHKELDADDDEMTRTRKVRRDVVGQRYADIIEALYRPAAGSVQVNTEVQYQDGRRGRLRADLTLHSIGATDGLPLAA